MSICLITGAGGFIGNALCVQAKLTGHIVRVALRSSVETMASDYDVSFIADINDQTDWSSALQGVDVVFHLAARVHVMRDDSANPLEEFRKVNVQGTENLARQAARAGVKRLVYVSSIKVNGEQTGEVPFLESDTPNPQDPYGISKWEAEQALHRVAQETGLEVVIVRPPLVYGAGVKGNMLMLFAAIYKGIPLPLAVKSNARNLLYVGNLVDALILCATHPAAAGKTYLVSDCKAVSTAELTKEIAATLQCSNRTFYFPPALAYALARLFGKSAQVNRLLGSLRIDSKKIREELAWTPPYTLRQGLSETAAWYRAKQNK